MRAIQLFEAICMYIYIGLCDCMSTSKETNNRLTVVATRGNDRNMVSLSDFLQTNTTNLKLGIRVCKFTFAPMQCRTQSLIKMYICMHILCTIYIEDDGRQIQYPLSVSIVEELED